MPFFCRDDIIYIHTYVVSSNAALIVTIVHSRSAGVDVYFDVLW